MKPKEKEMKKLRTVTTRMPPELIQQGRIEAIKRGITFQNLLIEALRGALKGGRTNG
jgi:predicted DNA binding CopG/RHH family protein